MAASRSNFFVLRLGQRDRMIVLWRRSACPSTVSIKLLVEIVLRIELIILGGAVFPGVRAQVAERDLALAIVEFRHLPEIELVALAGVAGEIVEDAPARRDRRSCRASGELEVVDRAMRRQARRPASAARPAHAPPSTTAAIGHQGDGTQSRRFCRHRSSIALHAARPRRT